MSITVRHDAPAPAGLAVGLGQSVSAAKQGAQDEERLRFLLGMRERRREVDVNAALRLRSQDIEQQQYQQNLARQNAAQQSLLANQEANRQAQLYSQQMREEYDMAQQQQEQMFQYAAESVKTIDEQVKDTVKASQQMKLNPEGQRILNEKMGKLREIQQDRASMRPAVYASLLGQWQEDYQTTGLDAYEVKEPTAAEKVYSNLVPLQGQQIQPGQPLPPGTYRSLKGVRNGVESWETITIPEPVSATFAEDVEKNRAPAPDGGFFYRQPDGKVEYIPPPKPEKPTDFGKYIKEAKQMMIDEYNLIPDPETGKKPAFKLDKPELKRRALEIKAIEDEMKAELGKEENTDNDETLMPDLGPVIAGFNTGVAGVAGELAYQEQYEDLMGRRNQSITGKPSGTGTNKDPFDLRELSEEEVAAAVSSAGSQSVFRDEHGNLFVKP